MRLQISLTIQYSLSELCIFGDFCCLFLNIGCHVYVKLITVLNIIISIDLGMYYAKLQANLGFYLYKSGKFELKKMMDLGIEFQSRQT